MTPKFSLRRCRLATLLWPNMDTLQTKDIHYLASHLLAFTYSNVRRYCNKVAHSLARKQFFSLIVSLDGRSTCKHKISQLQKIKKLKRNMACKYKFVLMYNEYNLYFNSFTKEYPLILSSLNLTRTRTLLDFGWKMDWTVFTTNL